MSKIPISKIPIPTAEGEGKRDLNDSGKNLDAFLESEIKTPLMLYSKIFDYSFYIH